jgi:hypothetical protein
MSVTSTYPTLLDEFLSIADDPPMNESGRDALDVIAELQSAIAAVQASLGITGALNYMRATGSVAQTVSGNKTFTDQLAVDYATATLRLRGGTGPSHYCELLFQHGSNNRWSFGSTANDTRFYVYNYNRNAYDLVIANATGNVGIANLNPGRALHVGNGSADTRAVLNPNTQYALGVQNGANFGGWWGAAGTNISVLSDAGGTERVRFNLANGHTGFGGNSSPACSIDTNGHAKLGATDVPRRSHYITGTTSFTPGTPTNIAHGLDLAKILYYELLIQTGDSAGFTTQHTNSIVHRVDSTNFSITPQTSSTAGKAFRCSIWYRD